MEIVSPTVAVVGAGYWGKNLVRNFFELHHLSVICDSDELMKPVFANKYPGVEFKVDFGEVLKDSRIDAVVLSTPAATHYRMVKEALSAGKHVFVEKPLSLETEEGAELVDLAERNSRVLMVGHILQYHPVVIKLKELIDSGELGKIQHVYSNRLNIGKIRSEENILWSFAPHDISLILMLLRESPESVYANGGNYLQEKVADVTITVMNFPSGVKAHIFVSWLHPFKEQKLVVVGNKKMAVFDDLGENKLTLYPHQIEWLDRTPVASKAEAETVAIEMTEPLKEECRHFLSCINHKQRPKTDGLEGLRVLEILSASQKSIDRKGEVIHLKNAGGQPLPSRKPSVERSTIHESAYIDDEVIIGNGVRIWHFSHVLKGSTIGKDCRIGQNVTIGPNVTIGDGCKIQNNVSVYEGVTLEDHVFCGPSMVFTNVYNPRSEIPRMTELRTTLVKRGATIGANSTILCGLTIGEYAFIGAGAVVTEAVCPYALVVGIPAKRIGWMCRCGLQLNIDADRTAICQNCGVGYKLLDGQLKIDEARVVKEARADVDGSVAKVMDAAESRLKASI